MFLVNLTRHANINILEELQQQKKLYQKNTAHSWEKSKRNYDITTYIALLVLQTRWVNVKADLASLINDKLQICR